MQSASTSIRDAHDDVRRIFRRSDLVHRSVRVHSRRLELLFSTRAGRFCLYMLPQVEGSGTDRTWVYGILFVYDGMKSYTVPVWHALKGTWSTANYDDQVWHGPADAIAGEAIAASKAYRFLLEQEQRPDPGVGDLP